MPLFQRTHALGHFEEAKIFSSIERMNPIHPPSLRRCPCEQAE